MSEWNLGSVATETLIFLADIPDNISGAPLERVADRQRQKVEEYTGVSIGSNSIGIKYQEAILQLTIAKTANTMMSIGADVEKKVLGDFSVSKGRSSNLATVYNNAMMTAKEELKCIGGKITLFKANG